MKRILYALYNGVRYKKSLFQYLTNPLLTVPSVLTLTAAYFVSRNIQYIVLDFDGVLASHGETRPCKEAEDWLIHITQQIPERQFALLSNKPFSERLAYFQQRFPAMTIISGVPKKPYPEGLNQLVAHFNCAKKALVLVDDRLLTGMLAVCLAGVQGVYIGKAYRNWEKRPTTESFFSILRWAEKKWIRWLAR